MIYAAKSRVFEMSRFLNLLAVMRSFPFEKTRAWSTEALSVQHTLLAMMEA
jgi:hypothetical protein